MATLGMQQAWRESSLRPPWHTKRTHILPVVRSAMAGTSDNACQMKSGLLHITRLVAGLLIDRHYLYNRLELGQNIRLLLTNIASHRFVFQ